MEADLNPHRDDGETEGDDHGFRNDVESRGQADLTSARQSLLSLSSVEDTTADDDQALGQEQGHPASSGSFGGNPPHKAAPGSLSFFSFIWTQWIYEILAITTAILALVAIIVTLVTHDGRTLPNWPYRISVNAIVSVFGVILKGLMLVPVAEALGQLKWLWYNDPRPLDHFSKFDEASRGIWGSIKLLLMLHGKRMPSLGAAITILAMASDPFIQQILRYHPCATAFGGPQASILRTGNYTGGGQIYSERQSSLDAGMQVALHQGVLKSYSTTIDFTCTTGNCSFSNYRTVGMCHSCRGISNRIEQTGPTGSNWTLNSGMSLEPPGAEGTVLLMHTNNSNSFTTNYYSNDIPGISRTQILSLTGKEDDSTFNASWAQKFNIMAIECDLIPCIHTYKAEVSEGVATETLLQTTGMTRSNKSLYPTRSTDAFVAVPIPCLINGTYYNASAFPTHPNKTHNHPVPNLLPGKNNNVTAGFFVPSECVFSFGAIANLGAYLPTFLEGHVGLYEALPVVSEPSWMVQVYNYGNATLATIDEMWAALAGSITLQMRRDGVPGNSSAPAIGSVWKTETCVSVQWEFLAYPAALLGLSVVFLAATIWKSASLEGRRVGTEAGMRSTMMVEREKGRRGIDCWKGSSLAVLFHGVGEGLREECRGVERVKEMEKIARVVRVQVRDEGDGYEFVKT